MISCPTAARVLTNQNPVNELAPVKRIFMAVRPATAVAGHARTNSRPAAASECRWPDRSSGRRARVRENKTPTFDKTLRNFPRDIESRGRNRRERKVAGDFQRIIQSLPIFQMSANRGARPPPVSYTHLTLPTI